ncbi:CBS domain-containing protein [Antrihabitans sp. YC2-6]|uniref:CBS domain-containing protein n=1 Tax=Antrihabitans sp. YC2-6 TaxID=2799498 RepID=UPI0018F7877C|nr:CBS domain-containing protein [Antrihabitans sp. YC2-6]MBJ8344262.1 CBS domain-containing protein [Antrihabitans sp. YC2-6]
MRISDVLRVKGAAVATVEPTATVAELIAALADHNVGALVVLDGQRVIGIVSERDVVRKLHADGEALMHSRVSEIMTKDVYTCAPDDTVDSLAEAMTQRRVRHMPVVDPDGSLAGIVSIGDVVKSRISQLESDREQLESYIAHG